MSPQRLLRMESLFHETEKAAGGGGGTGVQLTCQVGDKAIRPPPRDAKDLAAVLPAVAQWMEC